MDKQQMYETGADWTLEGNRQKKTKIISEMKTKLQGTQGKIDITRSSVRDVKKRNEKESRKWNWNKRAERIKERMIEKIQYI